MWFSIYVVNTHKLIFAQDRRSVIVISGGGNPRGVESLWSGLQRPASSEHGTLHKHYWFFCSFLTPSLAIPLYWLVLHHKYVGIFVISLGILSSEFLVLFSLHIEIKKMEQVDAEQVNAYSLISIFPLSLETTWWPLGQRLRLFTQQDTMSCP